MVPYRLRNSLGDWIWRGRIDEGMLLAYMLPWPLWPTGSQGISANGWVKPMSGVKGGFRRRSILSTRDESMEKARLTRACCVLQSWGMRLGNWIWKSRWRDEDLQWAYLLSWLDWPALIMFWVGSILYNELLPNVSCIEAVNKLLIWEFIVSNILLKVAFRKNITWSNKYIKRIGGRMNEWLVTKFYTTLVKNSHMGILIQ